MPCWTCGTIGLSSPVSRRGLDPKPFRSTGFLCIRDATMPTTAVARISAVSIACPGSAASLRRDSKQHLRPRRRVAASGLSVGLRSDQTIRLCAAKASTAQAEELRRVSEVDSETKQKRVFLTNPFDLAALIMPRSIGAAGASHFSSARPRSTCASAKFSVTRRTQCGSKSGRQRPPAFPLPSRSSKRIKRRQGLNGRKSKSGKMHFTSYL